MASIANPVGRRVNCDISPDRRVEAKTGQARMALRLGTAEGLWRLTRRAGQGVQMQREAVSSPKVTLGKKGRWGRGWRRGWEVVSSRHPDPFSHRCRAT